MGVECEKDCVCDVKHVYVHKDNSDTYGGKRKIGAIIIHRTQKINFEVAITEKNTRIPWDLVADRLGSVEHALGSVEHALGTMKECVIYGNRIALKSMMATNVSG